MGKRHAAFRQTFPESLGLGTKVTVLPLKAHKHKATIVKKISGSYNNACYLVEWEFEQPVRLPDCWKFIYSWEIDGIE
jgi:hypothetical protein